MKSTIGKLESAFTYELPGPSAQNTMAPRGSESYRIPSDDATPAAVMILLYPNENEWFYALMKRRNVRGDIHAGQISLPGGKYDESDLTFAECALRETEEELGIDRRKMKIIGKLTELYVFASNHLVHPFLGFLEEKPVFNPDNREVSRVIEVSLKDMFHPKTKKFIDIPLQEITLRDVPYYDIDSEVVWGATAMILEEFLRVWKKAHI